MGRDAPRRTCGADALAVGVRVDEATIDAHPAYEATMRTAARSRDDRCARVVEEVVRGR